MESEDGRREEVRVAGRVELVTQRPIVLPRPGSPRARAQALLGDHRWLVGAAVGSLAVLALRGGERR